VAEVVGAKDNDLLRGWQLSGGGFSPSPPGRKPGTDEPQYQTSDQVRRRDAGVRELKNSLQAVSSAGYPPVTSERRRRQVAVAPGDVPGGSERRVVSGYLGAAHGAAPLNGGPLSERPGQAHE